MMMKKKSNNNNAKNASNNARAIVRIDWVIVGGESGPGARPMHPDWVRDIRDRCQAARIPFFFKQWGTWGKDNKRRSKKANGREYRGATWDEMPIVATS